MADDEKRVVVDSLNFEQILMFPRILRTVIDSLQPPRLIIGLLMVVTLVTTGRIWDTWTTPLIHPDGLVAYRTLTDEDVSNWEVEKDGVRQELRRLMPEAVFEPGSFDAQFMKERLRNYYQNLQDPDSMNEAGETPDEVYARLINDIEEVRPLGIYEATATHVMRSFIDIIRGAVHLQTRRIYEGFSELVMGLPHALWKQDKLFTIVYSFIFILIIAIGGGALTRMSACELATQQRLSIAEAMNFATGNTVKLVMAMLWPLVLAGLVAIFLMVMGLLMLPWLDIAGGPMFGLALLFGFLLSFLLIVYLVGCPFFIPAVACENCDAADAPQRAYAYVLSRPLHWLGYVIIALVGAVLGYVLVAFFASTMINITAGLMGVFNSSPAFAELEKLSVFDLDLSPSTAIYETGHDQWSAWFIKFWYVVVMSLVAGYVFVYFFSSSTAIYLLLRYHCDRQDVEDIWQPGFIPGTRVLARPDSNSKKDDGSSSDDEGSS